MVGCARAGVGKFPRAAVRPIDSKEVWNPADCFQCQSCEDSAMDKLTRYREIARHIIHEYAGYGSAHGDVKTEAIIDLENDHYELMRVGWQGERRIHGCVIHLDIINDKIWIQHDGTNWPVADALLEAGVPQEDIVLGFHPADVRPLTGFAAA